MMLLVALCAALGGAGEPAARTSFDAHPAVMEQEVVRTACTLAAAQPRAAEATERRFEQRSSAGNGVLAHRALQRALQKETLRRLLASMRNRRPAALRPHSPTYPAPPPTA